MLRYNFVFQHFMIQVKAIPPIPSLTDTKSDVTFSTLEPGFGIPSRLGSNSLHFAKRAIFVLVIVISCGHVIRIYM